MEAFLPLQEWMTGDQEVVDSLIQDAKDWQYQNIDLALSYAQEAVLLAFQSGTKAQKGEAHYWTALLKKRRDAEGNTLKDALVDAKLSRVYFEQAGEGAGMIRALNLIGILHFRMGNEDSATIYQNQAIYMVHHSPLPVLDSLGLLGELYQDLGNTYRATASAKAEAYYRQSQAYFERGNSLYSATRLLRNLGDLALEKEVLDTAIVYYEKGLNISKAQRYDDLIPLFETSLGLVYSESFDIAPDQGHDATAEAYLRQSLQKEVDPITTFYLGRLYHYRAYYASDEAIVDSALKLYQSAMQQAARIGDLEVMEKVVRTLPYLCGSPQDPCHTFLSKDFPSFQQAQYQHVISLRDSSQQAADRRLRAFALYQTQLAARRQQGTWILGSLLVGLLALMIFGYLYQGVRRQKLIHQLKALRAQINPHFVANTINAIESLVNQGEKELASDYLIEFTQLNRRVIAVSREEMITLEAELDLLESYLKLIQLRLEDRLSYSFDVDPTLRQDLIWVPGMITQPFVENAIFHGLKPKEEGGKVELSVRRVGNSLMLIVDDDGIGRAASQQLQAKWSKAEPSYGIQISRERLTAVGKVRGSQIKVEDKVDAQGLAQGTRVIIQLLYTETKKSTP
ncbi:MAG: histidine kinase [Bacteroidota bacterium]